MLPYSRVTIIGVGLIGGSIGLALKERRLVKTIVGVGRRQASLDRALACGAIDSATTDLSAGVATADVVIVATPVASVADHVIRALAAAPSGALITDVGSTKANLCRQVATSRLATETGAELAAPDTDQETARFVGSHPLAGDHRTGPEHARADLLEGKVVVVTPTSSTAEEAVAAAQSFWEALGAHVLQMSPEKHDQALATTSHLPHLVASALAAVTPRDWLPLAAGGWADTTRVAAADPQLWAQIFAQNTPAVITALDRLIDQLTTARSSLLADNSAQTEDFLQQAKRTRDALGN